MTRIFDSILDTYEGIRADIEDVQGRNFCVCYEHKEPNFLAMIAHYGLGYYLSELQEWSAE